MEKINLFPGLSLVWTIFFFAKSNACELNLDCDPSVGELCHDGQCESKEATVKAAGSVYSTCRTKETTVCWGDDTCLVRSYIESERICIDSYCKEERCCPYKIEGQKILYTCSAGHCQEVDECPYNEEENEDEDESSLSSYLFGGVATVVMVIAVVWCCFRYSRYRRGVELKRMEKRLQQQQQIQLQQQTTGITQPGQNLGYSVQGQVPTENDPKIGIPLQSFLYSNIQNQLPPIDQGAQDSHFGTRRY
mmetsp:Transcript_8597/g.9302  ORF Transcript_8597/g.9302 Transcript_8597/m.9302 type:complete len:249 (+) Transcript_8597:134-880(+)